MSMEFTSGPQEQQHMLTGTLQSMQRLHADRAEQEPDEEILAQRMLHYIGEETRRMLLAHLRRTHRQLLRHAEAQAERTGQEVDHEAIDAIWRAIRNRQLTAVFAENWYDSILSVPGHPIHAKGYGVFLFRKQLRLLMAEEPDAEKLQRFGWVSFDVNGLKALIDCTTYENATRSLQTIAQILTSRQSTTRIEAEKQGIRVTPLAAGGDEFALFLRGQEPIPQEQMDMLIRGFQTEVSRHKTLAEAVDLRDPQVLRKFLIAPGSEQEAFDALPPEEQQRRLAEGSEELPPVLPITIAGGGATLNEGIVDAIEMGTLNPRGRKETFDTIRQKIIRRTIELAEERQHVDKVQFKRSLKGKDPRLFLMLLRNKENRRLAQGKWDTERRLEQSERENAELRQMIAAQQERLNELLGEQHGAAKNPIMMHEA